MEGQVKCFPDKVKLKEFIITKLLLYEMLKDLCKTKIKTMNTEKWQQTHNYQQLNLKKRPQNKKLSEQLY